MSRHNNDGLPVGLLSNSQILNTISAPAAPSSNSEISSNLSEANSSSPYIPTPLSITSNDLPLPKITQPHTHQRNLQNQSNPNIAMHQPPYLPSSYLPSYHSDSRSPYNDSSSSSIGNNDLSTHTGDSYMNSIWERMSRSGPSQSPSLEGVNLPSQISGSSRTSVNNNGNNIGGGIGGYNPIALMDLAGIPHIRGSGLTPENNSSIYDSWSGSDRINPGFGVNPVAGLPTWQPGPSSISASQLSQSTTPLNPQIQLQESTNNSPISINRQISASPHQTQSLSSSNASPRFQPYPSQTQNQKNNHQRIISSSSSPANSSSGSMLPPPNPQQLSNQNQQQHQTMSMGRSWSEPNLPENTLQSAGYPGIMYTNVNLPEGYIATPPFGGRAMDNVRIGPDEFSQAYEMYNHILSAIPYISPLSQIDPSPANSAQTQPFHSLIGLASDSYQLLTGSSPSLHASSSINMKDTLGGLQKGKRRNSNSTPGPGSGDVSGGNEGGSSKKVTTKCLGCGATETPEWRRGPMGPRTLCNACGLVHMKLQRKKKKAEEKARAAAAAATGSTGGGATSKPG